MGGIPLKGSKQLIAVLIIMFLLVTVTVEYRSFTAQRIEIKAVLDRIEEDQAVLLLEHWNEEIFIPVEQMPEGSKENMWFHIEKKNNQYHVIDIDEETSQYMKKIARKLNEKLKSGQLD